MDNLGLQSPIVNSVETERTTKINFKYRTELDGLRCIAVLSVIFYHAGFNLFKCGFVGVDLFFVISGYLMTTIILSEIEAGEFSLKKFYERRARRILPMLYFTILICYLPAYYHMIGKEFLFFSRSVSWASVGASNFLFAKTTNGYFDTNTDLIPLMHTWTLGVEEQFYLIIPLIFVLLWRFGKNTVLNLLISLSTASFTLTFMDLNSNNKFYLIHTRLWELAIGSIIAFMPKQNKSEIYSYIGLCAIFTSILVYDDNTPNPSYFILLPTLGTAFLILFSHETFIAKTLSFQVFAKIGLSSYSAYLLHQPVFAFARIQSLQPISQLEFVFLISFTLFISYFTWIFIENYFRNKKQVSLKFILSMSILFVVSFQLSSYLIANSASKTENIQSSTPNETILPSQHKTYSVNFTSVGIKPNSSTISTKTNKYLIVSIPRDLREINAKENYSSIDPSKFFFGGSSTRNGQECHLKVTELNFCLLGAQKAFHQEKLPFYFLTGDSSSRTLAPLFETFDNILGLYASRGYDCQCLLSFDHNSFNEKMGSGFSCLALPSTVYQYVKERNQPRSTGLSLASAPVKMIFLAGLWSWYRARRDSFELFRRDFNNTVNVYIALNVHVFVVQQPPMQYLSATQIYRNLHNKKELTNENLRKFSTTRAAYREDQKLVEQEFSKYKKNPNITFIYIEDLLCDDTFCPVGTVDEAYYEDSMHLSVTKSISLKKRFQDYISRVQF